MKLKKINDCVVSADGRCVMKRCVESDEADRMQHIKKNQGCTVRGTVALIEERIDFTIEKFRKELSKVKPGDSDKIRALKRNLLYEAEHRDEGYDMFKKSVRDFLEIYGTFDRTYRPCYGYDGFFIHRTSDIDDIAANEARRRMAPEIELKLKSLGHPME